MRYVLLTRTNEENLKLAEQIELKGIKTISFPIIRLQEIPINWLILQNYSYIVITSKYAARLVAKNINYHIKAFVVGTNSASILNQNAYIQVMQTFSNASELASCLQENYSQNKIAYICGNVIKIDMPCFVEKYVIYATLYESKMPHFLVQKIINMEISVVMLYSENSARTFINLCKRNGIIKHLHSIIAITLSLNIKKVIAKHFYNILYCDEPKNDSMLKLLYKTLC